MKPLLIKILLLVFCGLIQFPKGQTAVVPVEDFADHETVNNNNINDGSLFNNCGKCDRSKCPARSDCKAGIVYDRCACCAICALEEGHLCNFPKESGVMLKTTEWHGFCGDDLECRSRTDVDEKMVGTQSVCFCTRPGLVCGSDQKTYSWCQMKAVEQETKNKTKMISHGPCKTEPRIVTIARSQVIPLTANISMLCEVEGYPMPSVTWYYIQPTERDNLRKLPGDDATVSVSFRGGPQAMRISSHLQIASFGLNHEGRYRCHADNDMGMIYEDLDLVAGSDPNAVFDKEASDL